jgi:hypothetical protein
MQKSSRLTYLLAATMAFGFALASTALGQGITTSAINGIVTDKSGAPVAGATVVVLHEPTGTRSVAVTRPNGQYNLSGMRVGGPYTVSASAKDLQPQEQKGIYLSLEENAAVDFRLSSEVVSLEAFTVSASRDTTFDTGKMGTATAFSSKDISNIATVRRNVQDIASLDSRLFLGSLDQGGQLSAQGQNFRFNSLLVDGVRADDTFGLNSNGFSSLRSPIPLDAIENINVQLSPYDTRYAGFTGALLNATIKSGTNAYHGSAYYELTEQDWRAPNPVTNVKEVFHERTMGATFGGPIIKDRLFFFLAWEDFKRVAAPPQANFIPDGTQLAAVIARAKSLGYDTGGLDANNTSVQRTFIGKLDWNIASAHRLSLSYRKNYGHDSVFASYTGTTTTSLSNFWYQQPRNTDAYTAQLFSQWTPDFRTEVDVSYNKFDGSPSNNGAPFPQVLVNGLTGTRLDNGATISTGAVVFGTESSRQLNKIITKETVGRVTAEYSIGDHTLSGGAESDSTKYNNAFVQYTNGYYTFANPGTWQAGSPPSAYQLAKPYPGFTINDAIARWQYDAYALFLQDTIRVNQQTMLMLGLRYDYPHIPQAPPVAPGFAAAGFTRPSGSPVTDNTTTNNGNDTLAPRIGFTYKFKTKEKTQLRGGVGLFQGKNPAVWISNAYSNAGAVANATATVAQLPGIVFSPDVNNQPIPGGALGSPNINITDPNFKQPALWKSNLAFDRQLPFGGIDFTAEIYHNKVSSGLNVEFLNYKVSTDGPGTLPDGRIRYGPANAIVSGTSALAGTPGRRRVTTGGPVGNGFADVFYLTNTTNGESDGLTLSFQRPMKNHWAWSASWTRGHATEVSPITSSVASSNYSNRTSFNPNEDIASISNTNIKDRFVVTMAREFELFKGSPTTVGLVYQLRTGHPYSWVFRGDANGDGYTFNDLIYVPAGPNDPRVNWASTTERDNFFAFISGNSLQRYMGTHPSRNSEVSPWTETLDLKITQDVPLFKSVRAQLYVNLINLGNFINKRWGTSEEVPFSYRRSTGVGATYNATANGGAGQWNYTFNSANVDAAPVIANDTPISRWQIQAGMKIHF